MPPKANRRSAEPTSPVSRNPRRQFQTESLPTGYFVGRKSEAHSAKPVPNSWVLVQRPRLVAAIAGSAECASLFRPTAPLHAGEFDLLPPIPQDQFPHPPDLLYPLTHPHKRCP